MKIFKLRPFINKRNGQMNFSLPKKDMPEVLKKIIKDNPGKLPKIKMKFQGFDME